MLILVETIMIIAYMINGTAGTLIMVGVIFATAVKKNKKNLDKLLSLCIISLPISFIGILGMDMYHIISWYNIFLFTLLCYIIKKRKGYIRINNILILLIFLLIFVLFINVFRSDDIKKSIIEIIQILLMIFPVFLIHCYRETPEILAIDTQNYISMFGDVCIANSFAAIFQHIMYFYIGKEVGFIWVTAQGKRVICNCLFKGMSILSIYFGLGFVILLLQVTKRENIHFCEKIKLILGLVVITLGLIVNTSRTGVMGVALAIVIYFGIELFKRPDMKKIIIMFMCIVSMIVAAHYLVKVRGNFFNENGRIETYKAGIMIWRENLVNFFIGGGLTDAIWIRQGTVTAHNMFFQSLAQCGLIGTSLFMILFFIYFGENRYTHYKILIIYLIITGMAVTDFYANTFTTVMMFLVDISGNQYIKSGRKNRKWI